MRRKILEKLSSKYSKDLLCIKEIIESKNEIESYNTVLFKKRKIINIATVANNTKIKCDYYMYLINSYAGIKFPNRTYIMKEIFNIIPDLHLYQKFSLYKFDFEKFFYNVDTKKIYKAILNKIDLYPSELSFFKKYLTVNSKLYPGIGLHNSLIEFIGREFDLLLKSEFRNSGLIYYSRYVDDCVLILDEEIEEESIKNKINSKIKEVFGRKLKINDNKTDYCNQTNIDYTIEFLGYCFEKGTNSKNNFKYGIAESKLKKTKKKISEIIKQYTLDKDLDLLSYRLELFYKRLVFYGDRKNDGIYRWQVMGISDSYKELKQIMIKNKPLITKETNKIFKKDIIDAFKENNVTYNNIPNKIKNQFNNGKFEACFKNNRAVLLHKNLGLSYVQLKEKVEQYTGDKTDGMSYSQLANVFINKILI